MVVIVNEYESAIEAKPEMSSKDYTAKEGRI